MSAQTLSFSETSASKSFIVSFRVILSLYAIIPICFLLYGLDNLLWQQYLLKHLPHSPHHFLLFQILFGTPHILASSIIMVSNTQYLQYYKAQLIFMSLLIFAIFGLGSLLVTYQALYVLTVLWTVFHILKQQHGIARGICGLPAWACHSALIASVIAGTCIYLGIYLKNSLSETEALWLQNISGGVCLLLLITTLINHQLTRTTFGKLFLWGNSFLVLGSFYFYIHQYYFLAILIPRLVHDATAFIFYMAHDYNKHQQAPQNLLYRLTKRCHIHCVLVLPILAFGLTYLLQNYGDSLAQHLIQYLFDIDAPKAITLGLIGYLSMMHYYTEGLTWQKNSPYRQFIKFKM